MKKTKIYFAFIVAALVLMIVWVFSFSSCKPVREEPIGEYVDVSINLTPIVIPASRLGSQLESESIESISEVSVAWRHRDYVDPNMLVNINFTAGSAGTGETKSFQEVYSQLGSKKFRVKRGTYTQVNMIPEEYRSNPTPDVVRYQYFVISAAANNVNIIDASPITLEASTNFQLMIVPDTEGSIIGSSWPVNVTIDNVATPSHYFYHNFMPDTSFSIVSSDDGSTIVVPFKNHFPGGIFVCYIGINTSILVDGSGIPNW